VTAARRARALHHAAQAAVCDVLEPWAHGTVVRATRYPDYYDYNVVRVEEEPALSVEELIAFADEALAGLRHRRIDFEGPDAGAALRPGLKARGWETVRLVWMRHEAAPPPGPEIAVEEVPYEAVLGLREAWFREDFPGHDPGEYQAHAQEVAQLHDARVFAAHESGSPIGYAQLERFGDAVEIAQVYVHPDHRGEGRGMALTRAAIGAAGDARDLWIVGDDEGRPKELYARLGFRPAWVTLEALKLP
jgi:GNAT superfamily N-acetyltransferase